MLDDNSYDTINLVHDAQFEVMIAKDLFWVPVNALGSTRYKNGEIKQFVLFSPEEKRAVIKNAYEAVQLFHISRFQDKVDVLRLEYNGRQWEHHKPGYHAVLCNYGCCSSIAAWFDYIIGYIYQNRGYIVFSRPDGSGHVMNYIHKDDCYYIIDLTAMTYDKAGKCCKETGIKRDYVFSKYSTGCCLKVNDIHFFVNFHSRIQKFRGFDFLYYTVLSYPYLPPVSVTITPNNTVERIESSQVELLDNPNNYRLLCEEGPNYSPNWNYYSDHVLDERRP